MPFLMLASGLGVGVLADALLRAGPWGVNAAIVVFVLALAGRRLQAAAGRASSPMYLPIALALGAGFAWRDATVLKALDALALLVVFGLWAAERIDLAGPATLAGYAVRLAGTAVHTIFGVPMIVGGDVPWETLRVRSAFRFANATTRGLIVALPVVFVFALLLTSADPVFAADLQSLLDVDVASLVVHATLSLLYAWAAAGWLRAVAWRERPASVLPPRPAWVRLGAIEVGLVLGAVDTLFAGFVWVQARYLFGGATWRQSFGMTYSEYARRGFFELVAVVALFLSLLLAVQWLLAATPAGRRVLAVLGGVQVVLTFGILVSALTRMRLYEDEYGLTRLRVYTTAFMLWLAVLLAGFCLTALRGRRVAFARLTLASGLVALAALHGVSPDRIIVSANRRARHPFDAAYAAEMSADAVPALLDVCRTDLRARAALAGHLLAEWGPDQPLDLRTWSVARAAARRAVAREAASLRATAVDPSGGAR